MYITDLTKHGIDQRIVDLWTKSGIGKLLPIGDCLIGELLTETAGMLDVTAAGKMVAAKGVDIHTALVLLTFLDNHRGTTEEVETLEVLWALTGTPFGAQIRLTVRQNEVDGPEYRNALQERINRLPS